MSKESKPHRPVYQYCSSPEHCCWTWNPLWVECAVCGEHWPCATKRSHHTEAQNDRIERWAKGRAYRPAKVGHLAKG